MYRSIGILLMLIMFTSAAEFSFCGKGGLGFHWPYEGDVQSKSSVVLSSSVMFNKVFGLQLDPTLMRYTAHYKDITIAVWDESSGTIVPSDQYDKVKVRESYFEIPLLLRFEIPLEKVRPFFVAGGSIAFSPLSWKSTVFYTESERVKEDRLYGKLNSANIMVEEALSIVAQYGIVHGVGIEIPVGPGFVSVEERYSFIAKDLQLLLGYGIRF